MRPKFNLLVTGYTLCLILLAIIIFPASGAAQAEGPKLVFSPEPQKILYAQAYPGVVDTIFLGHVDGFDYEAVQASWVTINDVVPVTNVTVLESHPDFEGQVLQITFPSRPFILGYGILFETSIQPYTLAINDVVKWDYTFNGEVEFYGHLLGDVNGDEVVNVLDITYMISFIYDDGPAPIKGVEFGDINQDSHINLLDVLKLIDKIY